MGRTKLTSDEAGEVHEAVGYGDFAGTLSRGRRFGKFSFQLSRRRA